MSDQLPQDPIPLNQKATLSRLTAIAHRAPLTEDGFERALTLAGYIPSAASWRKFIDYALLILGAAFAVSGIIFFFAFNWAAMSPWLKFGLVEVAIVAAIGSAYYRGLKRLSGQISLMFGAVLVGGLLAVYGQVYQTGANTYTLFFNWALLIAGWVFIGQFGALWLLWLALLNMSLGLYGFESSSGDGDSGLLLLLLFALNATGLALWELGRGAGWSWLKSRWEPRLIAIVAFIFSVASTLMFISGWLTGYPQLGGALIFAPFAYLAFCIAVVFVYTRFIKDLLMLTLAVFSAIVVITFAVGTKITELNTDAFGLLLIGILIIIQAALAVNWLQRISKSWEARHG